MMRGRATGFESVFAMLRNVAELVPSNARKVMHRGADLIVKEAKLNTPVDKHNLEESIRKEVEYVGPRGRLVITIASGGMVNGVDVDEYVVEIHENYDPARAGKGTLAKMKANPGRVIGAKFLERALRAQEDKLRRSVIEAVMLGTKGRAL